MEKNSAEALVIGAGIVGSSITHYLSEKGVGVTLLDKGSIAGGATGKATAVIRMHYTNPWDSAMAKIGGDVYSNWGDLIGGESGFVNSGVCVHSRGRGGGEASGQRGHPTAGGRDKHLRP